MWRKHKEQYSLSVTNIRKSVDKSDLFLPATVPSSLWLAGKSPISFDHFPSEANFARSGIFQPWMKREESTRLDGASQSSTTAQWLSSELGLINVISYKMLEDSNPQVSPVRSITRNKLTHEQLGITLQLAPLGWSENNVPQEPRVQRVYHHLLNLFPENWPYLGRSVPHFQTNPYIYIYTRNNVDYIYIHIQYTLYHIQYCFILYPCILSPVKSPIRLSKLPPCPESYVPRSWFCAALPAGRNLPCCPQGCAGRMLRSKQCE